MKGILSVLRNVGREGEGPLDEAALPPHQYSPLSPAQTSSSFPNVFDKPDGGGHKHVRVHLVQEHESLHMIANIYGMSRSEIILINRLYDSHTLVPGQTLYVLDHYNDNITPSTLVPSSTNNTNNTTSIINNIIKTLATWSPYPDPSIVQSLSKNTLVSLAGLSIPASSSPSLQTLLVISLEPSFLPSLRHRDELLLLDWSRHLVQVQMKAEADAAAAANIIGEKVRHFKGMASVTGGLIGTPERIIFEPSWELSDPDPSLFAFDLLVKDILECKIVLSDKPTTPISPRLNPSPTTLPSSISSEVSTLSSTEPADTSSSSAPSSSSSSLTPPSESPDTTTSTSTASANNSSSSSSSGDSTTTSPRNPLSLSSVISSSGGLRPQVSFLQLVGGRTVALLLFQNEETLHRIHTQIRQWMRKQTAEQISATMMTSTTSNNNNNNASSTTATPKMETSKLPAALTTSIIPLVTPAFAALNSPDPSHSAPRPGGFSSGHQLFHSLSASSLDKVDKDKGRPASKSAASSTKPPFGGGGSGGQRGVTSPIMQAAAQSRDTDIVKERVLFDTKYGKIGGVLIVLPYRVMFEPNLGDRIVAQHGTINTQADIVIAHMLDCFIIGRTQPPYGPGYLPDLNDSTKATPQHATSGGLPGSATLHITSRASSGEGKVVYLFEGPEPLIETLCWGIKHHMAERSVWSTASSSSSSSSSSISSTASPASMMGGSGGFKKPPLARSHTTPNVPIANAAARSAASLTPGDDVITAGRLSPIMGSSLGQMGSTMVHGLKNIMKAATLGSSSSSSSSTLSTSYPSTTSTPTSSSFPRAGSTTPPGLASYHVTHHASRPTHSQSLPSSPPPQPLRSTTDLLKDFEADVSNRYLTGDDEADDIDMRQSAGDGPVLMGRYDNQILTDEAALSISGHLPARFRYNDWRLLYSSEKHGISIRTMYEKVKNKGPAIFIIEDVNHFKFGGYTSEDIHSSRGYYGTAEAFLFQLFPTTQFFHYTANNKFFMLTQDNFVSMGGGITGRYGFWLDGDFFAGSSGMCDTFNNTCLASSEDFECLRVEVWGVDRP